jgi:hypothetical protein
MALIGPSLYRTRQKNSQPSLIVKLPTLTSIAHFLAQMMGVIAISRKGYASYFLDLLARSRSDAMLMYLN